MNTQKQTLIRLTADSSDSVGKSAIFEGVFNDGILIEPNSQIGLQSATLSRSQDNIVINSSNDKITFQLTAAKVNEIRIPHGVYDMNTLQLLLDGIRDRMNNELDMNTNNKEQNTFIDVNVDSLNKVQFNFDRGSQVNITTIDPSNNDPAVSGIDFSHNYLDINIIKGTEGGSPYLTGRLNGAFNGTRNQIYSSVPFIKGSGSLKVRLDKFVSSTNIDAVGVVIGLLKKTAANLALLDSNLSDAEIKDDMIEYGLRTSSDSQFTSVYQIKTPGLTTFFDSTQTPLRAQQGSNTNNDIMSLRLTNGNIEYTVSNNTHTIQSGINPPIPLATVPLNRRESDGTEIEYIPFIAIYGTAATTQIGSSIVCLNPDDDDIQISDFIEADLSDPTPFPKPNSRPTNQNLIFGRETVANYLGFEELNQNPNNELTIKQKYIASNPISKIFSTNTYLVEMLSEQLDSYDSFDGGRKNILCPIPISDHTVGINTGVVFYEPSNLIFINLRNDKKRLLRNLRARVVTNAYEPILIEGIAELNLLIKN